MKTRIYTLIAVIFITMNSHAQQAHVKEAFLEKWNNSSAYLMEIAGSIPEGSLDYKPTPRQMSVKEQLLHIRSNMLWLGNTYFNPEKKEVPAQKVAATTKADLLSALEEAFQTVHRLIQDADQSALQEEVEFFAGPKTRLQILNLLQDHVTHHRGQLIVYMNLLDITPPRYSGW